MACAILKKEREGQTDREKEKNLDRDLEIEKDI